jgi:hypothetical protein
MPKKKKTRGKQENKKTRRKREEKTNEDETALGSVRYRTPRAVAERRIDALQPHDPYIRLSRLIWRSAEQLQVPLFRVRPCTREVLGGDCPDQLLMQEWFDRRCNRVQK